MKKLFFVVLIMLNSFSTKAQVTVAKIFADNMVLQRNTAIPVWGWAKANEKISVSFNKQTKTTKADKTGKWIVRLDNEVAGGPYNLVVKAKNTIEFKNVLVGEVWICSGQSNMEWSVGQSDNAKKEIADAANYPNIRHIKIEKTISSLPNKDLKNGVWNVCNSTTVADFTGIGYFYAKNLYDKLHIPIGLINASWGGTNIETWISREGFENSNEFKEMIAGMPKISLDSLLSEKISTAKKRIETLQKTKLTSINTENFKEPNLDDTTWLNMNTPEVWEKQELGEFDGVVWLRKHFTLTKEEFSTVATLEIPAIDDEDITYINGVKIGETKGWDAKRDYKIAANILKEGDNVIAIRVVDNGGGGGIYGDANNFKLVIGKKEIALSGNWKYQVEAIKNGVNENDYPNLLFNSMINPIIPYAFQGVIWYQGESNAPRAYQYRTAFPLLINDWRQKWNQGNFPFYFVQLATFATTGNSNEGCGWAELREAQTQTLQLPNTGMCVITDVGNPNNIHPTNKQTVGKRLAAIALSNVYNEKMVFSGPAFKALEINENQAIITFDNCGTGLSTPDKYGYIKGFEIAGDDHIFYYAKGYIKDNKVILYADKVANPKAVHFGWLGDASDCNLYNNEGFPAVPFRTDEWINATQNEKYKIVKMK